MKTRNNILVIILTCVFSNPKGISLDLDEEDYFSFLYYEILLTLDITVKYCTTFGREDLLTCSLN